jgi:hypothetical protein
LTPGGGNGRPEPAVPRLGHGTPTPRQASETVGVRVRRAVELLLPARREQNRACELDLAERVPSPLITIPSSKETGERAAYFFTDLRS